MSDMKNGSIDFLAPYVGKRGNFLEKYGHVLAVATLYPEDGFFLLRDFTEAEKQNIGVNDYWSFPTKVKVVLYGKAKRTDNDENEDWVDREEEFTPLDYGACYDIEKIVYRMTWTDYPHELLGENEMESALDTIEAEIQRAKRQGRTLEEIRKANMELEGFNDNDTESMNEEKNVPTFSALYDNAGMYKHIQKQKSFVECVENVYKEMNYWCEKTGTTMNDLLGFIAEMGAKYREEM